MKLGALLACALLAANAFAQPYPTRPIRIVVPWPPGGLDLLPRVMAEPLAEALGQQVVVENRAGAGGTIGLAFVAKAPADGYTIAMTDFGSHAISASLYRKLPYDVNRDLTPVAIAAGTPMVLVANPSLGVTSVRELVELARARPGTLNFASSGNGAITHLAAERLKRLANIDLVHVPYKGSAPAVAAVIAGDASVAFATVPPVMPHARSGKLQPLGVSFGHSVAQLPQVAPIGAHVPGFEMGLDMGMLAPTGTPRDAIERLGAALARATEDPKVREFMRANVFEPRRMSATELEQHLAREIRSWSEVVHALRLTVD